MKGPAPERGSAFFMSDRRGTMPRVPDLLRFALDGRKSGDETAHAFADRVTTCDGIESLGQEP